MSLGFCLLASGSKGNAYFVKSGSSAVLVDCGISARQTLLRMQAVGLDEGAVKAIIITHEHKDHTNGARVLAKRLRCPVMATPATWQAMGGLESVRHQPFEAGRAFEVDGLKFRPFTVSHDAADPVGLVVSAGSARLGIATDLGIVTRLVLTRLTGCQALIVESNHDPVLLANGPYQQWLKQRVRSREGHLSNQQGAELLSRVQTKELRHVVLAHLSEINNRPELAQEASSQALERAGSRASLHVAAQAVPSEFFEI